MTLAGSLVARIVAMGAVVAVLLGGAIAALVLTIDDLRDASRGANRSQQTLLSANRVEKHVVNLQTGTRGFRLTREERFLESWGEARRALPIEIERMTALAADHASQTPLALTIGRTAQAYLDEYSVPTVEAVRAGREPPPVIEDKRRVDALRAQFARFEEREAQLSAAGTRDADAAAARSIAIGIVVLVVGFALLVAFAAYIGRTVALPVRRAAVAADRLAGGDLSVRLPARGRGGVARLSASFNAMGESLQDSRDELETQHTALEEQTAELESQGEQLAHANDELRAQRDELERTSAALAEEAEREHLFNVFSQALSSTQTIADRATQTLRVLGDVAGAEVGVLYAEVTVGYELLDVRGLDADALPRRIGPGDGLAGRVIVECRTIAADRGQATLRAAAFGDAIVVRHELHVPLSDGERVVAVLSLARSDDAGFSERERELVEALAGRAALALSNAFATAEAQRLAEVNRAVLDTVRDAILLTDPGDGLVLANARASQVAQEVLGVSIGDAVELDPEEVSARMTDPDAFRAAQEAIAADPDEPTFDEFELAESGRVFERYTEPVRGPTGQHLGRAAVYHEVTAEREAERLKNDLMATVSHELRTPLASIVGFTELLLTRDADPDMQRSQLETVHDEARRLASLIDDFLDLQRVAERGRIPLERRRVDLRPIVSDQAKVFSAQSGAHTLDVQLPEQPLVAEADAARLKQVLANLLSNAIKYSPEGGRIGVDGWVGDGTVGVAVLDSGLGIPSTQQPKIFDRFYRTPEASARAIGGTGLGLALAREIVEAHDGRMGFESVEGQGSRFWFELPAAASRSAGG